MSDTFQIVTLAEIDIPYPGNYPLSWVSAVKDWMGQWTVGNNYDPVLVKNRNVVPALRGWRDNFLAGVHTHFHSRLPKYAKENLDTAEVFRFQYWLSDPMEVDKEFVLKDLKQWVMLNRIELMVRDQK